MACSLRRDERTDAFTPKVSKTVFECQMDAPPKK
jgi:hypothetical protein